MKIAFQTKESISRKSHRKITDFTCFSKGCHSNTFTDIILNGFNWIITKWRTQSHPCSWAIWHKSPLNIHYHNFEHTTKCIIFTTSPDHILIRHCVRAQRADILQTTFSYVLKFSLSKIVVFRFELHPFVPLVKLAIYRWYNWFNNGLAPSKWEAIISANDDIAHWCVLGPQWVML